MSDLLDELPGAVLADAASVVLLPAVEALYAVLIRIGWARRVGEDTSPI